MRTAHVLFKSEVAGTLTQWDDGSFSFEYRDEWTANSTKPSISYTLPKSQKSFRSPYLFPYFFGLIPEGSNKEYIAPFFFASGVAVGIGVSNAGEKVSSVAVLEKLSIILEFSNLFPHHLASGP